MKNYIARGAPPLLLLLALLSGGCKKNTTSETIVSGQVTEIGTDNPVPNATVYAIECEGGLFEPTSCYRYDSTVTDQDGRYSFEKEPDYVVAAAPRYWKSEFIPVLFGKETRTHVTLTPHAWLRVTIRNESGAWGFYPPRDGSGFPPIQVEKGKDSILIEEPFLRAGNIETKYLFTVRQEIGASTPPSSYWDTVKAFVGSQSVPIEVSLGAVLKFYLPGHDTSDLIIVY